MTGKGWGTPSVIWPILTAAAGALLCFEVSFGVVVTSVIDVAEPAHVLLSLATGFALLLGLWTRRPALLLGAFPVSVIFPLLAGPTEGPGDMLGAPRSWVWMLTLLAYVTAASIWSSRPPLPSGAAVETVPVPRTATRSSALDVARGVFAVALLAVPAVALLIAAPAESLGRGPGEAVFAHMVLIFFWSIALYSFFIGPLLDRDADVLTLRRAAGSPPGAGKRRAATALVLALAIGILWLSS